MPAHRHPLRYHITTLCRRGDIATVAEAVLVSGLSRQTISRWLRLERIDLKTARMHYVARQRSRAQLIADGKPPRRRPSKDQMRRELADAMGRSFVNRGG